MRSRQVIDTRRVGRTWKTQDLLAAPGLWVISRAGEPVNISETCDLTGRRTYQTNGWFTQRVADRICAQLNRVWSTDQFQVHQVLPLTVKQSSTINPREKPQ